MNTELFTITNDYYNGHIQDPIHISASTHQSRWGKICGAKLLYIDKKEAQAVADRMTAVNFFMKFTARPIMLDCPAFSSFTHISGSVRMGVEMQQLIGAVLGTDRHGNRKHANYPLFCMAKVIDEDTEIIKGLRVDGAQIFIDHLNLHSGRKELTLTHSTPIKNNVLAICEAITAGINDTHKALTRLNESNKD